MVRQSNIKVVGENIRTIIRKYDEYVVYVSIVASIIIQFIPDSVPWKDRALIVFIYSGILSLIFILLDMKNSIENRRQTVSFKNMFEARGTIFSKMEDIRRQKTHDEIIEVRIIGLKLRAITGLLHDLLGEIKENSRPLYNMRFIIYYFDPMSLDELISPNTPGEIDQQLKVQLEQFRIIVQANVSELLGYNSDEFFHIRNIKFQCCSYNIFPSFWGFGIDNKVAFVGPFTWNSRSQTIVGPQNPCIMVDESDEKGRLFFNFHYNRLQLYADWGNGWI